MDKAQKELIDTYFRKREIMQQQGLGFWGNGYNISEYIYMLNHEMYGYFKMKELSGDNIVKILIKEPTLISPLEQYIKNDKYVNVERAVLLLKNRPEFAKYLQNTMNKMNGKLIAKLILAQPTLINKFNPDALLRMSDMDIKNIISERPESIDSLMMFVRKMDGDDIGNILIKQPQLIEKFKPYLYKIDKNIAKIIGMHVPELKKYMDNIKRDNITLE